MTSHLFKLIYNQRRSNGWIVFELFLIFILIWVLVDFFSVLYLTARTPVGADITDMRISKSDDLAGIGRISEDFLITGH